MLKKKKSDIMVCALKHGLAWVAFDGKAKR